MLTQGGKRVTAFLPTDGAFRILLRALNGPGAEDREGAFTKLAKVAGVDTIETVLLYHVVPGATITKAQAAKADGAKLTTAAGRKVTVNVRHEGVFLRDRDRDSRNPRDHLVQHQQGQQADRARHQPGAPPDRSLSHSPRRPRSPAGAVAVPGTGPQSPCQSGFAA